jgi:hypothetical protein
MAKKKITTRDIKKEQVLTGVAILSAIVDGQYTRRIYMGLPIAQALNKFKSEVND